MENGYIQHNNKEHSCVGYRNIEDQEDKEKKRRSYRMDALKNCVEHQI